MSPSHWLGRLVKTLDEVATRRGVVVDEGDTWVVVRYRSEFGFIEGRYSKTDVQFID